MTYLRTFKKCPACEGYGCTSDPVGTETCEQCRGQVEIECNKPAPPLTAEECPESARIEHFGSLQGFFLEVTNKLMSEPKGTRFRLGLIEGENRGGYGRWAVSVEIRRAKGGAS